MRPLADGSPREDRERAEVLAASAGLTAQAVADAVVAALAFQHGPARDDIAVVVVRKPSQSRLAVALAGMV